MSCLTKEQVKTKDAELVAFELDTDRSVMLRAISATEFLDLSDEVMEDGEISSKGLFMVSLVRKSACDEQGKLLFDTNLQVEGTLSIHEIAKIAEKATEVSGLDLDDTKKN